MKRLIGITLYILVGLIGIVGLTSCENEPETDIQKERLILIYAIAANNLQSNLGYDMDEILAAAPELNLKENTVLVYSVVKSGECVLHELKKGNGNNYYFNTVRTFPELPLSTSAERINEVCEFVSKNYDYPYKGLILWSHADGWLPWFGGSNPQNVRKKSFGWDDYQNSTYKTNITSLAEAIPENTFDFIWFDCCYMANIETVYQLKEKTEIIVGSVLEIAEDGMPYHLALPYLLKKKPDFQSAAFTFFSYYDRMTVPVSVSIMEMNRLENLADACRSIFRVGALPSTLSTIQNYSRVRGEPFYDMGQLLLSYDNIDSSLKNNLKVALENCVTYKLISDYDFNGRKINTEEYSGLSIHNFIDNNSSNSNFYKELDWYKATR